MYESSRTNDCSCHCLDDNDNDFGFTDFTPDNFSIKKIVKKVFKPLSLAVPVIGLAKKAADLSKLKKINKQNAVIAQRVTTNTLPVDINIPRPPASSVGQIGYNAGAVTTPSNVAQQQSLGGSGGDIAYEGSGYADDTNTVNSGLSTPENPKELGGVTVTASKTNWLLIGIIAVVIIVAIVLIVKSKKK